MDRTPGHSAQQRTLASLLAALLALGPSGAALAAPAKGSVVALPDVPLPGASDAFAAKVFSQVQSELQQRSDLKLVAAPAGAAQGAAAEKAKGEAEKARAEATQLFNKAGELSAKGRSKQAAASLQKAAALFSAQPLALDESGGKLLGDLLLQLAVTRAMAGDGEGADTALAELVRRSPERTLAPGSFPPAFVRSFEVDRQRVLGAARGSIRIVAPAGSSAARVLLDGRPLDSAPLLLTEVLPGEHAVRVESGADAWATTVQVEAGAQLSLSPRLGAAGDDAFADALAQGRLDRPTAARLAKIAKQAGAQAALIGTVSHEGDGYTVRSVLVFAKGERVVPLAPLALDAEMLSASLEVLRLADDVVAKLGAPPATAALPLAMGGAVSAELPPMPSVVAAPPAQESPLALPAAADLAAAAGTEKKAAELPLPDATAGESAPPARTPVLAAAPAEAAPERAPALPEPAPIVPTPAHERTPIVPGHADAPALAATPAPAAPAPAPIAAAPETPAAPVPRTPAPAPETAVAAAPALPPAPVEPTPAPAPDRRVFVPGTQPPPLAAAPSPEAPAAAAPAKPPEAPTPTADTAALATAAPKRAEEPAPSKDLFVPRRPTQRDEDDQPVAVVAPAAQPAPPASVQLEAREANEIATVREPPAKKNHAVLWIVAGALVVGAAAVGGVILYDNSRSATSSNVSLSWSH